MSGAKAPKTTCDKVAGFAAGVDHDHQNEIVDYEMEVSGGNTDFVFTLDAENGKASLDATNRNSNGTYDIGICQLNSQYHAPFINSEGFKDWRNQVDYCWGVWQDAVAKNRLASTFYAYDNRFERTEGEFVCQ